MPILHKNLNNPADIHNPKWFDSANNGDYAWRNELGVLESTDELVLPAALDFVDASVAPPTTNTGDIYVLSSGGSVNAGWGSVALKDWVRYDGSAWNEITPQKSSLCYNEADDELNSFDGTDWNAIGGQNIGNANLTWTGDTIQDLDGNSLTFQNGGNVVINNTLIDPQGYILNTTLGNNLINLSNGSGNRKLDAAGNSINITFPEFIFQYNTTSSNYFKIGSGLSTSWVLGNFTNHRINPNGKSFFNASANSNKAVIFGNTDVIGTELVSLRGGATAIQGAGTSTGTTLVLYDNDTTPNETFEVLDNGNIFTNGNQGFTGTGAYTNFTIENGIITAAS
jgi:hypothetical protein